MNQIEKVRLTWPLAILKGVFEEDSLLGWKIINGEGGVDLSLIYPDPDDAWNQVNV